ncbi:MAG: putative ATPase [Modestobacter sp.]|jgi:DNA helicase HerA-like ATPase|nr:putative ATPase [Modestobacter sp.]
MVQGPGAPLAFATLVGGEVIGTFVVEILRIPHVTLLADDGDVSGVVEHSREDFARLLIEIHQMCYPGAGLDSGCCVELLWASRPVADQPHAADVRLFLVGRMIGGDRAEAGARLEQMQALVLTALAAGDFDHAVISAETYAAGVAPEPGGRILALVKDAWIDDLQNAVLPRVLAFDRLPEATGDLSRIAGAMVEHPGCTVSVQLIPTTLSPGEQAAVEQTSTALHMLGSGIADQTLGHVSLLSAAKRSRVYEYYDRHKAGPLFLFNIVVAGPRVSASVVASRVSSHLASVSAEQAFTPRVLEVSGELLPAYRGVAGLPWRVNELLLERSSRSQAWAGGAPGPAFCRLPFLLTAGEASEIFRLPVANSRVGAGFKVNETVRASRNFSAGVVGGSEIQVGELSSSQRRVSIGFNRDDLAKHAFVTGTPGSGKTTFIVGMLDQLWREHGIPFLVIEPAKTEYRALIETIPDLQVFTPGKNSVSPFIMNPFTPPENVRLESYKSTLKTAFSAAVTMASPLDRIFEEAIANAYSKHRWFDSYTTADPGETFGMLDFLAVFRETFERIGYVGEAQNIGRAGQVRLNSLVRLFDNHQTIPIADLMTRPTVVELAAVENPEEKALIIALLLLNVMSYVNGNLAGDGKLKNVLLLEEAHVLLDARERGSQHGDADPAAIAKALLRRMLAELRSYGVGLVVADQSPRKVSSDIVALTNIKVGFRLVEAEDKEIFAQSTNMADAQKHRLARLRPGQAMLFYERLEEPEEVTLPDARSDRGIRVFVPDEEIARTLTYWRDNAALLVPYRECAFLDSWDVSLNEMSREIARRVFLAHLTTESAQLEELQGVYRRIDPLIRAELPPGLDYSAELASAIRLNFLRFVKYYTRIPLTDGLIRRTLQAGRPGAAARA